MLRTTARLLTFRLTADEYDRLGWWHLLFGLGTAWAVGYGRWWDRPDNVDQLLRSGFVSVLIVLALGVVFHIVAWPFRPRARSLLKTTAFISLTSAPAALYALPLSLWMGLGAERFTNIAMLALVAIWRVALVVAWLRKLAGLSPYRTFLATLTPLALAVFLLTINGFLMGIFQLMAGLDDPPPTVVESRYEAIAMLGIASVYAGPVLLLLWFVACVRAGGKSGVEDEVSA